MEKRLEMESIPGMMARIILGIGKTIKWMEKGNIFILQVQKDIN